MQSEPIPRNRHLTPGKDRRRQEMLRPQGAQGDSRYNGTRSDDVMARRMHIAHNNVLARVDPRFVWVDDKIIFRPNRPSGAKD